MLRNPVRSPGGELLLCALLAALSASAPARGQTLEQLHHEAWRWREVPPPEGLSGHSVIALDREGLLYSATGRRVSVFDGSRWTTLGETPDDVVTLAPHEGGALVSTRAGVCYYVEGGELARTPVPDAGARGIRLLQLRDDTVVASSPAGLFEFVGTHCDHLDLPPLADLTALERTFSGELLALANGRAWLSRPPSWTEIAHPPSPGLWERYGRILTLDGELWILPGIAGFRLPMLRFTGSSLEPVSTPIPTEAAVAVPGRGILSWHSDRGGFAFRDGAWHEVRNPPGLEGQIPIKALCGGERIFLLTGSGRLWTLDYGASRWHQDLPREGFANSQALALGRSRRGGVWVGSGNGLLRWNDGEFVEQYATAAGLPLLVLTAVCEDRRGDVWVGSGSGFQGLVRLHGDRWERVDCPASGHFVHAVEEDDNGNLWFMLLASKDQDGSLPAGGLLRFDGSEWRRFTTADGLPDDRCYDVLETPDGRMLAGTLRGIARLEGDRWVPQPALGSDPARNLFLAGDGTLWVSAGIRTPGVRAYRDGEPRALSDPTLERLMVGGFAEQPGRGLWLSSRQGLFLLDDEGLLHPVSDEPGVPARSFWPVLVLDDDSLLLGSLAAGVVTFRALDHQPPEMLGLDVTVDGEQRARAVWEAADPWGTTPRSNLRYRWRLAGTAWSAPTPTPSVTLGRLPFGDHELEVEAIDALGNHSALPARTHFEVRPPFWARPGGWISALAILGLGTLSLRQWRSARRRAREERSRIAASERHYRTLVERVRVGIASFDDAGKLVYASPVIAELLGEPGSELSTAAFLDRFAPPAGPEPDALRTRLQGSHREGWEGEIPVRGPRERESWWYATLSPQGRGGWDFVAIDLTERKEGEQRERLLARQLSQSRQLASIGRLAAGVGHDFNNLLTAIAGNAEVLDTRIRSAGLAPLAPHLSEIELATRQAQALTRRLLDFGREPTSETRVLDLDATIEASLPLLRRLIQEGVEFSFEAGGAGPIESAEGQIERVLFNLVLNAQDAMPGGGRLWVDTRSVRIDSDFARRHPPLVPGEYAVLCVSDEGEGMDDRTLQLAFEPFFTTKDAGRGTGLGLATVHQIVAQRGGRVVVSSKVGAGSTFRAYFPAAPRAPAPRSEAPHSERSGEPAAALPAAASGAPAGGGQTILFCEDDSGVRSFVRQCLEDQGYRVLTTERPEDALSQAAALAEPIDLLLTDVIMPKMNGRELAQRVCAARPGLPVLYVSGYSADLLARGGLDREDCDLLRKPFRPSTLLARVREALARRSDAVG